MTRRTNWLRVPIASLVVVVASAFGSAAFAVEPSLGSISPYGVQRGTDAEMVFGGGRLADAKELLFYSPGFTVKSLEATNDGSTKAVVSIAPDCRLGIHAVRLRTATGISNLRTFTVGNLPEVKEVEPNNDFLVPQVIQLNVTVSGIADNEDVDHYVVELKKGQRLSAELEGLRLGNSFFDPYVAILAAARLFEVATRFLDHALDAPSCHNRRIHHDSLIRGANRHAIGGGGGLGGSE